MRIVVTFTAPPYTGDVENPAAWDLDCLDGVADLPLILTAVLDGAVVTLGLDRSMTPGGLYRLTAPAGIYDQAGNALTDRDTDFVQGAWGPTPPQQGLLEALTGALGDELARLVGRPRTRLTAPMAADADAADVESTLGFQSSGQVYIGDRLTTYSGIAGTRLMGLVHEVVEDDAGTSYPLHRTALPIGTEVADANVQWSLKDQAKADTMIVRADADALQDLGRDTGFARPLAEMTVEDFREYLLTQSSLDRGTWLSVYRVLRPVLRWASQTGTNGRAVASGGAVWLVCPGLTASRYADRWIIAHDRWCRVRESRLVAGERWLLLEATDGPQWQGHDLVDGMTSVSWELLAYRVRLGSGGEQVLGGGTVMAIEPAAHVQVDVFASPDDLPYTYLMDTDPAAISTDGRPAAGIVREDYTEPSLDVWPMFLLEYPRQQVEAVLRDVVPATTFVSVRVLPP